MKSSVFWICGLLSMSLIDSPALAQPAQRRATPEPLQRRAPAALNPADSQALQRVDRAVQELTAALMEVESRRQGVPLRQWVPPDSPGPYWPFPQGPWEPARPNDPTWRATAKPPSAAAQRLEDQIVNQYAGLSASVQRSARSAVSGAGTGSSQPQALAILPGILVGVGVIYVGCTIHVEFHQGGLEGPRGFDNLKKCLHERLGFF